MCKEPRISLDGHLVIVFIEFSNKVHSSYTGSKFRLPFRSHSFVVTGWRVCVRSLLSSCSSVILVASMNPTYLSGTEYLFKVSLLLCWALLSTVTNVKSDTQVDDFKKEFAKASYDFTLDLLKVSCVRRGWRGNQFYQVSVVNFRPQEQPMRTTSCFRPVASEFSCRCSSREPEVPRLLN